MRRFKDRSEAGQLLAQKLIAYKNAPNAIVLGLARGGIVVAYEIAKTLKLPLNVLVPKKIGAPHNPELAIGAVAEDGELFFNQSLVNYLKISLSWIEQEARKAKETTKPRLLVYRKKAPLGDLKHKTVLLVDDGVATGATMLVEIQSLRKQGVEKIIAAAPVAAASTWAIITQASEASACLAIEEDLDAVSEFYDRFDQVEDETVLSLL